MVKSPVPKVIIWFESIKKALLESFIKYFFPFDRLNKNAFLSFLYPSLEFSIKVNPPIISSSSVKITINIFDKL